ncbi:hypothetical protein [Rhodoferax potami]
MWIWPKQPETWWARQRVVHNERAPLWRPFSLRGP